MWAIVLASTWAFYAAAISVNTELGVHFTSSTSALPNLTLPYGSWKASQYDSTQDVWVWFSCSSFRITGLYLPIILLTGRESPLTKRELDIHVQEYSLRCPSCRKLEVGETGGPSLQCVGARWKLWEYMCSRFISY
jgi:hypothetical protein